MLITVSVKVAEREDGSIRYAELCRLHDFGSLSRLLEALRSEVDQMADLKICTFSKREVGDHRSEATAPPVRQEEPDPDEVPF
jgi:hypothetical protein